ncbi:MAG: hypothetical protein PUD60_03655, partial [Akkermansia muciniphila]|nr:hypothetical protein [Akkermansia muciniphila]
LFRASPYRGAQSLLLFLPNVKLIFAKIGKKVQKAAKKCQKRTIFGKIGTKTPFKTPEPRQNGFKTAQNAAKSPENALLVRAREHTQSCRTWS